MKLWLASYPRSGNTLIRLILRAAFDLQSTSLYPSEDAAMAAQPGWFRERIGYAGPLSELTDQKNWVGIKTHGLPIDDAPAIYIVRDGRAAVVSYRHMLHDFTDMCPSLEEIIAGEVWPGSWSEHVAVWIDRPDTLTLRYEDLKQPSRETLSRIAAFLGTEQVAPFEQQFSELHDHDQRLFRSASNQKNISELGELQNTFMARHGAALARLGYV